MTIAVTYNSQLSIVETLAGDYVSSSDDTVTTNGLNTTEGWTASSTPPASKYSAGTKALVAGAGTIDLTSLPDADGTAGQVDFTGLKVQGVKLRNKSTNANNMTLTAGASNGYDLHGASWSILLRPGEEYLWRGLDLADDVDGTHKTIDIAGTGTQILEFEFIAG